MPKKSKPKQRTNWKQRALHCEAVIAIHSQLEKISAEKRREYLQRAESAERQTDIEVKLRDEYWNRALTAEKHNALLLEERANLRDELKLDYDVMAKSDAYTKELEDQIGQKSPTHWQRFKSWLIRLVEVLAR